jgi:hypothetical protein
MQCGHCQAQDFFYVITSESRQIFIVWKLLIKQRCFSAFIGFFIGLSLFDFVVWPEATKKLILYHTTQSLSKNSEQFPAHMQKVLFE